MLNIDKLVISHWGNIRAKYGSKEKRFLAALKKLVKASKVQNLSSKLIFLDDEESMEGIVPSMVRDPASAEQFKDAVDALYLKYQPEYIVLAGAQDIIPFQSLKNPAWRHDDEKEVPSDLPYACDVAYSQDARKFLCPTRVVGRLPDVPGADDPSYFEQVIQHAISFTPKDEKFYKNYFGLSTVSWKGSSGKNIARMFGDTGDLYFSPESGPSFRKNILKASTHFINCHGALEDPFFYGEKGKDIPEALVSKTLEHKITGGALVAAECCYGAQLFNREEVGQLSIANNYLLQGAIAFLGSSNIAYGPSDDLALADLLTQYFINNIFSGASTGSALLEARIQFLQQAGPYLDVVEVKTMVQFLLLGDPSLHPVKKAAGKQLRSVAFNMGETRENRRENLKARGRSLSNMLIPPVHTSQNELPLEVQAEIKRLLKENGMKGEIRKEVYLNADPKMKERGKSSSVRDVKFVVYSTSETSGKIVKKKILVIKKKGVNILGTRLYLSR